jgi:hypothetical protein
LALIAPDITAKGKFNSEDLIGLTGKTNTSYGIGLLPAGQIFLLSRSFEASELSTFASF